MDGLLRGNKERDKVLIYTFFVCIGWGGNGEGGGGECRYCGMGILRMYYVINAYPAYAIKYTYFQASF